MSASVFDFTLNDKFWVLLKSLNNISTCRTIGANIEFYLAIMTCTFEEGSTIN